MERMYHTKPNHIGYIHFTTHKPQNSCTIYNISIHLKYSRTPHVYYCCTLCCICLGIAASSRLQRIRNVC